MSIINKLVLPVRCATTKIIQNAGLSRRHLFGIYSSNGLGIVNLGQFRSTCTLPRLTLSSNSQRRWHSQQSQIEDLSSFLDNEIAMESAAWREREKGRPEPNIAGFDCTYDGAMVTLTKRGANEQVTVKFSVSASIDSGEDMEEEMTEGDKNEGGSLCSRPEFTVDIRKGSQVLSFLCSFISPADLAASGADTDVAVSEDPARNSEADVSRSVPTEDFQINEFAIHDADLSEDKHSSVYSADCSVIDGELYDRLLEYLEQRGIDDKFAQQVVRLATTHEHNCYLRLLRSVQKFVKD